MQVAPRYLFHSNLWAREVGHYAVEVGVVETVSHLTQVITLGGQRVRAIAVGGSYHEIPSDGVRAASVPTLAASGRLDFWKTEEPETAVTF